MKEAEATKHEAKKGNLLDRSTPSIGASGFR